MNVTVEELAPCKKLVRVEVDAQAVDAAFDSVAAEIQRVARLPGFRPGKAPRDRLLKTFSREIQTETRKKLLQKAVAEAAREKNLHIVGRPDIEEAELGQGQPFQFTMTCETAPDFELPEYKGLPARVPSRVVTPGDLDRALTVLREKKVTYHDVDRPAQTGDFVVVNYAGTCEGKPLTELAPTAKGLTEHKKYWLRLEPHTFLPGFAEQLTGVRPGEQRTVTITFPPNFQEAALAGKQAAYQVEVLQVKERHLPELEDAFAKGYGAENLDTLREGVRKDLQKELNYKQGQSVRRQVLKALLERVTCDLPESIVLAETKGIIQNIVEENHKRGISKEAFEEKKEEIYSYANANAKERIKTAFLIGRIAAQEKIQASPEEVNQRITRMAQELQVKPDRLHKQLEDNDGLSQIENEILHAKVLDFLQLHARIEEDPSATFDHD